MLQAAVYAVLCCELARPNVIVKTVMTILHTGIDTTTTYWLVLAGIGTTTTYWYYILTYCVLVLSTGTGTGNWYHTTTRDWYYTLVLILRTKELGRVFAEPIWLC